MTTTTNIPAELRSLKQWVCWTSQKRGGRQTKVPYQVGGQRRASATDPATWTTYDAVAADRTTTGPGFVFTADDPYTGIDLDDCLIDGELTDWAAKILASLPATYTEISPSRTGLKLWVKGAMPKRAKHRRKIEGGEIEVYDRARFFTVTGEPYGAATHIAEADVAAWHAKWFPDAAAPSQLPPAETENVGFEGDDDALIAAIRRSKQADQFNALWAGELERAGVPYADGKHDLSSADQSLTNILAWWTGPDAERIDRIFRKSDLIREKWTSREDYRRRTIQSAIDRCTSFYTPKTRPIPINRECDVYRKAKDAKPLMMTDLGNAERLVEHFKDRIRYCPQTKQWFLWDGQRWALDYTGRINVYASTAVREIYQEARQCKQTDAEIAKELSKWGVKSESAARIDAMIRLASTRPGIAVHVNDLDADPWLFNASNGTIDLRTGVLRKASPDDLITKVSPHGYHPGALAPRWRKFLLWAFHDNHEMIDYVQELMGMAISGDISEQILPVFYGEGANGKSTLLDTVMKIVGDYAGKAATDLLMARSNNEHPTEIADLWGKRLVLASETEEGRRLRTSFVKEMTGDATCKARFMRGDFFEFNRTHKIILVTNNKPRITEGKHAMWRRLKLVPFTAKISDEEKDGTLGAKLMQESVGILAWLVAGCKRWHEAGGLDDPAEVRAATEAYRDEEDPLSEFVATCLTMDPDGVVPSIELRKLYSKWCEGAGIDKPLGDRAFTNRIKLLNGVRTDQKKINGVPVRAVLGIRVAQH